MPRDVAVERPHARVVHVHLDHYVPVPSQHLRVASQWVVRIGDGMAVPGAVAFGEDVLLGRQ